MLIKQGPEYENAVKILISHKDDKYFNNCSFTLSGTKAKKINDDKIHSWSELKFNFEFKNHDIKFGSIGGYKNIVLDRSSFLSWLLSIQDAVNDPNCYENEVTIKRRIKDIDFFVKFAISQKFNCNAVMIGVSTAKSGLIYLGIDSNLFNQYMMQLGRLSIDILNFEMAFDQSILLYKNNQILEYQINQNEQILNLLSNGNSINTPVIEVNSDNIEISNPDNIISDEHKSVEEENNENIISENVDEFLENLEENLEKTELEPLFEQREKELTSPPDRESKEEPTLIENYIIENKIGIKQLFIDLYNKAANSTSFTFDSLSYFFDLLKTEIYIDKYIIEEDKKSLFYLSQIQYFKLLSEYNTTSNIDNFYPIHLKFDIAEDQVTDLETIKNINDILSIYIYLLSLSEKLSNRETDITKNKLFLCQIVRLIFEPYYLSYYCAMELIPNNFETTILNHFYKIKKTGFFNDFDSLLNDYELAPISEKDLRKNILNIKELITENRRPLKRIHQDLLKIGIIKLSYKNVFEWEHINDICRIETILKDGYYTKEEIIEIVSKNNIKNKNIVKFLKKAYIKKRKEGEAVPFSDLTLDELEQIVSHISGADNTPLVRYINKYLKDVSYKNELIEFAKLHRDKDINLLELPESINIHQLPENILIALYKWKNVKNDKNLKSYSYFIKLIENCIESKSDIIAVYVAEKENILNNIENKNVDDWSILDGD